ncbi:MAG: 6,7-dimethyl-8-ribityllumazine synthase [Candidatus Hydrothermota bacterium]|nr:MAG: 6,7-dimethyl-8-ribityllumazine synthase [Candidatus Hydrothermae bacterium]RKZ03266.1 MAG: 6,7-dimethyl-8-ribityllumazine synthase [Candidatus Hydrothermae bacterium]
MNEFRGNITAKGRRIGVVVSRFNGLISSRLLEGLKEAFLQFGGEENNLDVFWVPGSFEIPFLLKKLAGSDKKYDGLVGLGCVIRGDTPHFDFVASEVAKGIARISLEEEIPVAFGVLTADSLDQALERAGGKMGNRGREALITLLETIGVTEKIRGV